MDGLLIDSERILRGALIDTLAAMGQQLPDALHRKMAGLPDANALLREHFGPDFAIPEFNQRLRALALERFGGGVPLHAGVPELLDFLEQHGIPKAIATSARRPTAEMHLIKCGIHHRFQAIATRDDVARGKPHPDVYLKAAADLGLAPAKCVALEDSHNGIRAAHAAGIPTIMVPDLLEPTEEISALCIAVLDDLHQVRRLFGGPS